MDDELATIASAGAGTLGTAMAADAWRAVRTGIAGAFRLIFRRRRAAGSPAAAVEPVREAGSGGPAGAARGRHAQTNLAVGGDVFAVQHGDMTVHAPVGQREADNR